MRVTCETIAAQINREALARICSELSALNDYERRLIEAWLRETNRNNARFLPPKAIPTFLPPALR